MLRLSRLVGVVFLLIVLATTVGRVFGAPLGTGLANVPIGPARPPVVLTVWYSTEKEAWLEQAVEQFGRTNSTVRGRPIQIQLVGMGSNEMVDRVVRQDWRNEGQPVVLSPASMLQVELLQSQSSLVSTNDAPEPLVITPLVLVAWDERIKALWPNGPQPQTFWQDLHNALADRNGWKGRGGNEAWGLVKFGHTSPLTSNSGMQTLLLLAYGFHNKNSGLNVADVQSAEFGQWMREIEQAVPEFPDSTGTFMDDMIRYGPSKYDFGMVYENLALLKSAQTQGGLRILYPPATLLSEHPFVLLDGSWVAPEQQEAARLLRAFLLGDGAQQLALTQGFRPANPRVSITQNDPTNPFIANQASGVRTDLGALAELPSTEVTQALLKVWQTQVTR